MQPILDSPIRYRLGRKGFPKKCNARLYTDRLELTDSDGQPKSFKFTEIKSGGFGNNVIVLVQSDGTWISLYFESLRLRILFRALFGLVGKLIVTNVGKSKNVAEMWMNELTKLGVNIRRA